MSDKIKTLSQAIRLGATFRGQCRCAYFLENESCALGAAIEAITGERLNSSMAWIRIRFGLETVACQRCPRCAERAPILGIIIHLNDSHRWTHEAIADWLETKGY